MAYQPGDPENYFAQAGGMSPQSDDPAMRALMSDVAPIPEWMQASQQMSPPGAPPQIPGLVADPETVIKELTNDRIVNQTQQDIAESRNARQEREEAWRESADLYNNVLDDTGKADWQSKVFIPQIFLKVEMACSLVKASFFQDPKWFTLEQVPAWDPGTADVQFVEHVCEVALEQAKFVDAYGKVVEEGFLYGAGCLKLVWEQYISRGPELIEPPPQLADQAMMLGIPPPPPMISAVARPRSRLRCYQVPIWNIYPDPFFEDFYEGRYTVEELLVDQEELEQGIQAGRYNCIESLDDIGEPCGLTYEYERRNREARLTYSQRRGPRKQHLLQIRYGNFYDSKGRLLVENWTSIVANKQKVIALDSNPSFTGKRPYIWCTPLPMRGSPWGREIIFAAKPLQNALNAIYNLTIDSTSYAVIPAVTINKNRLDPDEELDSITPGGGYYVTADNAIQPLKISSVPNEAMPMIQSFEQKIDEATMMYGTLGGEPPLKGRSTATQYKGELQQGQAQASLLARGLEMRDIEPAVQLVYENLLQYLSDVSDPKMQEAFSLFGGPQAFLDPATRFRLLNGRFKVKARGISGMIDRKNRADKLMQLATTAQMLGLPFQVQAKIFYRTAASMDIDPRELDAPPDEAAWQAYVQQMMAQQMGAGSQGGGANAREASPEPPSSPPGTPGPPAESTMENQMAAMTGPPAMG